MDDWEFTAPDPGKVRVLSSDEKARLLDAGRPIPDFDIGIASTALSLGLVLVSADRHMQEISNLDVEDWTK